MRNIFVVFIALFFIGCGKSERTELERFETISFGKSKLSFSEYAGIGGYQDIKEEEIERVDLSFSSAQKQVEENEKYIRVYFEVPASGNPKQDILDFIEITASCGKSERFFGFGEWSDYADATGLKREIWSQEQHAGRGDDLQPPFPFGKIMTYFPVPFFISSENYAFFVSGYARMEFSMCQDGKKWKVKVFSNKIEFFIFRWKDKPLEAIEKFTEIVGRQKTPPIWAFGNWIDEIFGQENVLKTAQYLRENKIPSSAIWTEDWAGGVWRTENIYSIGGWDIEEDKKLYPDIKSLSEKLEELGFKFLGYFHTFVGKDKKIYPQAVSLGILLKDREGKIKTYLHPAEGEATLLDLLNPKTKEVLFEVMGKFSSVFSGWMADFGEWVTPDLISYDGKTGWEFHNLYPYLWAKINREFWESTGKDFVFFSRSGFTGSWKYSPVVWQGDQNTSFERFDGIGSIIPSMTSIGMSGVANVGPDIAGYTTLFSPPSDKELYIRWTSICAFVPVFRTHHGTTPKLNWRFNRDTETVEIFRFYATEHMRLVPYIYKLSKLAEEKGYPAVRHIFLEYPHITKYLPQEIEVIEQEFLLGDSILVAPIVEKGKEERRVFLPPGKWVDYFSPSTEYDGGSEGKFITVKIPLGKIFVLVKKGSCIEVFDPVPHTLLEVPAETKEKYQIYDIKDARITQRCF